MYLGMVFGFSVGPGGGTGLAAKLAEIVVAAMMNTRNALRAIDVLFPVCI